MFSRTNTRKYAEERLVWWLWHELELMHTQDHIDEYCKFLVKLPPKLSDCDHVKQV